MSGSFTGPVSFYEPGEDAWWDAVDKALRGASRRRLYSTTEDGFEVAPLYDRKPKQSARPLGRIGGAWSIVQRIDIADPAAANAQILQDLEGGADGLEIVVASSPAFEGVRIPHIGALETLLKDVQLDLIGVRLDGAGAMPSGLALMMAYMERQGHDPATLVLHAGIDPFAKFAQSGSVPSDPDVYFSYLKDLLQDVHTRAGAVRVLSADGRVWHNAGATAAQELAATLAAAVAYLRLFEEAGAREEAWQNGISFSLSADADQFGTIAKARAFRALWSCVLDGAGLAQTSAHLHMSTSSRMLTERDPWVNLLRNTVGAFAAGIGGADSVCVVPHTRAAGLPDGFARRLARNTQSILLEESNLAKVMDPSAGSGAIENRTAQLCDAAWSLFQEIEAAGGLLNALEQGLLQGRITSAKAERAAQVASRKYPITGVSEYPALDEVAVQVMAGPVPAPQSQPDAFDDLPAPGNGHWFAGLRHAVLEGRDVADANAAMERAASGTAIEKLASERVAEPYERLRKAADRHERETGDPARIFLASLGELAAFTARATWTSNAFAAGGFRSDTPAVFGSINEMIDAFQQSGSELACIVSSDEVYESQAEEAARALKAAGARHLYLAGRPGERQDAYDSAGVDTYLYAGCNLLGVLEDAHGLLGIAAGASSHGEDLT